LLHQSTDTWMGDPDGVDRITKDEHGAESHTDT
jgi:hypothetical protein